MTNDIGRSLEEEVKQMLTENKALMEEIYQLLKKVHRQLLWQRIMGWVKIILVVVPLILAYLYLAPYLSGALNTYKNLLGIGSETNKQLDLNKVDPNLLKQLSPQVLEQLKQLEN